MIATATNTVVATVAVGVAPGVAVTPDGKHAYVTNELQHRFGDRHGHQHGGGHVPVGIRPEGSPSPRTGNTPMSRIVTSSTVSVIATATNTVVATVAVGIPFAVGIIPPPPGVPFLAFDACSPSQFGSAPTRMPSDLGPTSP